MKTYVCNIHFSLRLGLYIYINTPSNAKWHVIFPFNTDCYVNGNNTNSMLRCFCPFKRHTSYRAKYITHRCKATLSMDYKTVISKNYVTFHVRCMTKLTKKKICGKYRMDFRTIKWIWIYSSTIYVSVVNILNFLSNISQYQY